MSREDVLFVGDKSVFAIESKMTQAFSKPSSLALGYFAVHILGHRYGVVADDATMLACSVNEVKRRIDCRGTHEGGALAGKEANDLIKAFRDCVYLSEDEGANYFGVPTSEFTDLFYSTKLIWAPDGDEAFDDSSYIIQFDLGDEVRVIAVQCADDPYCDPGTLRDLRISADRFYGVLQDWHDQFMQEWKAIPKSEG